MNLELIRYAYRPASTEGLLLVPGQAPIATLEEGWRPDPDGPGGQRRQLPLVESCVQDGVYQLVPHDTPSHPKIWRLVNTALGVYSMPGDIPAGQKWGRAAILIHAGNSTADIEGCILVGKRAGTESNKAWLYESGKTLDLLKAVLGQDTHMLTIRPVRGTDEYLQVPQ